MFDKYYKSEYLKIKEYEKISNVSFEKFVLNIIKTESKKYPKRKESTRWIMMLLSFCFGLFIIIEAWNLFLWLGRDILSIKALLILGIPSIFVSGVLLRWIFSNDLTHIDLAKFFIVDNISLSELYLEHITSTEIIAEYSKNCTDDIIKLLSDKITDENLEEDNSLDDLTKENNNESNNLIEENQSIEESLEKTEDDNSLDNAPIDDEDISKDTNKDDIVEEDIIEEDIVEESITEEDTAKNNIDSEESTNEVDLDTEDISNKNKEEVAEAVSVTSDDLQIESEEKYDKSEIHKTLKKVLITNSLKNIESAKILLKDIIAIDTFEKSSPEDSLNKSLKESIYKEFKIFINDKSIIW